MGATSSGCDDGGQCLGLAEVDGKIDVDLDKGSDKLMLGCQAAQKPLSVLKVVLKLERSSIGYVVQVMPMQTTLNASPVHFLVKQMIGLSIVAGRVLYQLSQVLIGSRPLAYCMRKPVLKDVQVLGFTSSVVVLKTV